MLSKKAIKEFQKIMKGEYGVELSDKEATESANNLINLFKLLIKTEVRKKKTGS